MPFPPPYSSMYRVLAPLLVLWAGCSAAAATLQQLSTDQMAKSATAIVRARVTGASADFSGSTIYTHYQLQVSEVWKGTGATEVRADISKRDAAIEAIAVAPRGDETNHFLAAVDDRHR